MSPPSRLAFLGHPRFWVAAVSLVVVVSMGIVDLERSAPGPVSAVHGLAFEVEGMSSEDCSACHGGWFESMASACYDCHDEIEGDLDAGRGLHGTMPEGIKLEACGSCHGEHNGPGFQLAGPRSFKVAGAGSREDFDHSRLGFEFEGAHLELDCSECHAQADAVVLEPDQQRFRGLDQSCAACHEDDHAPVFPEDCTSCHDQSDWSEQRWDEHPSFFERSGAHADAACRDCHAEGSPASLEVKLGRRGGGLPEVRDCTACHETPHATRFLDAGIQPGENCSVCHETSLGGFESAGERLDPVVHAAAGFGLDAPHAGLDCIDCHAPVGHFVDRFPGRERSDCAACHDDPHRAQFAPTDDCTSCHSEDAFEPHLFGLERHARLSLPLTGAHAEERCGACHEPMEELHGEAPIAFRGTNADCSACHADGHAGFDFDGPGSGNCATCHDDAAFDHAEANFVHGLRTGFELEGAHGQEDCSACHLPSATPDETGRSFGRVAELLELRSIDLEARAGGHGRVVNQDCALCHVDVHDGVFGLEDGTLESCADCHSLVSFRAGLEGFEHGPATGFSLGGGHAELDCTACHADDPNAPRGRAPAAGASCASCHEESHGGQFEASPRGADCARCHAPEVPFWEPRFDHNADSAFALEGRHVELDCTACHGLEQIAGAERRRYWPLDGDCAACHGVAEGGRLRRKSGSEKGGASDL